MDGYEIPNISRKRSSHSEPSIYHIDLLAHAVFPNQDAIPQPLADVEHPYTEIRSPETNKRLESIAAVWRCGTKSTITCGFADQSERDFSLWKARRIRLLGLQAKEPPMKSARILPAHGLFAVQPGEIRPRALCSGLRVHVVRVEVVQEILLQGSAVSTPVARIHLITEHVYL